MLFLCFPEPGWGARGARRGAWGARGTAGSRFWFYFRSGILELKTTAMGKVTISA